MCATGDNVECSPAISWRVLSSIPKRRKGVPCPAERSFEVPSRALLPVTAPLVECVRAGTSGVPAGPNGVGPRRSRWAWPRGKRRNSQQLVRLALPIRSCAPIHRELRDQWVKPLAYRIDAHLQVPRTVAPRRRRHEAVIPAQAAIRLTSVLRCSVFLHEFCE